MKRTLVLILALVVGIAIFWFMQNQNSSTKMNSLPVAQTVETIQISQETDLVTIDIQFPKLPSAAATEIIEDDVRNVADNFASYFSEDNLSAEEVSMIQQSATAGAYILSMDYRITESDTLYSVILQGYEFAGGAHGLPFATTYTFDKQTDQRVSLDELFAANQQEYLEILSVESEKTLNEKLAGMLFEEGLAADPINWSTWYVSGPDSLTFIFQPYQVGPYAIGMPEVTMHVLEHKNLEAHRQYFSKDPLSKVKQSALAYVRGSQIFQQEGLNARVLSIEPAVDDDCKGCYYITTTFDQLGNPDGEHHTWRLLVKDNSVVAQE